MRPLTPFSSYSSYASSAIILKLYFFTPIFAHLDLSQSAIQIYPLCSHIPYPIRTHYNIILSQISQHGWVPQIPRAPLDVRVQLDLEQAMESPRNAPRDWKHVPVFDRLEVYRYLHGKWVLMQYTSPEKFEVMDPSAFDAPKVRKIEL